jgi:hypothetical protein
MGEYKTAILRTSPKLFSLPYVFTSIAWKIAIRTDRQRLILKVKNQIYCSSINFSQNNKYVLAARLLMHICFTIFIQQNKYPWPVFAKLYKDIQNNDT